jgi:H+/Cl- antiporter ClcA
VAWALASLLVLALVGGVLLAADEPWYQVEDNFFPPSTPPRNEVWDVAPLVGVAIVVCAASAAVATLLAIVLLRPNRTIGRLWVSALWLAAAVALIGAVAMFLDLLLWSPPTSVGLPKDAPSLSVTYTARGWVAQLVLLLASIVAGLAAWNGSDFADR